MARPPELTDRAALQLHRAEPPARPRSSCMKRPSLDIQERLRRG